jgi:hypothetical protein
MWNVGFHFARASFGSSAIIRSLLSRLVGYLGTIVKLIEFVVEEILVDRPGENGPQPTPPAVFA